jgi:uncharacterized Fe-S cluster protein YjdI
MKKIYEDDRIRVYWEPAKCTHSANCLRTLPEVFNLKRRPWIDISAAKAEDIKRCIETCPSRALTCELPGKTKKDSSANQD